MTLDKSKLPLVGAPALPSLDRPLSSLPIVQDAVRRVANSLPNHLWPGSGSGGDRSLAPAPTPATPSPKDAAQSLAQQRPGTVALLSHLPLSNHYQKQARKMQAMKSSVARHKAFAQRVASALRDEESLFNESHSQPSAIVRDPSPLRHHVERESAKLKEHMIRHSTRERGGHSKRRHIKTSVYDSNLWLPSRSAPPRTVATDTVPTFRASAGVSREFLLGDSTRLEPTTNLTKPATSTKIPLNTQDLLKFETVKVVQARISPNASWRPLSLTPSTQPSMKESVSVTKE